MWRRGFSIGWRVLALLGAVPLLAAEPESGQAPDPAPQAQEPATVQDATAPQDMTPAERDAALAEEIRAAEAAAANAPVTDNNESFVPSVQISEDLSVSFPADI